MDRRRRPDHQTACTSIERLSLRVHPAKICQPRNSEKSIPSQQELDLERRVPSSGNVGIAWPPVWVLMKLRWMRRFRRQCARRTHGVAQPHDVGVGVEHVVAEQDDARHLAGAHVGFYGGQDTFAQRWKLDRSFTPAWPSDRRERKIALWNDAVSRTLSSRN